MRIRSWNFLGKVAVCCLVFGSFQADAQIKSKSVKIGLLGVFSSFGTDYSGPGASLAVQMAIDDFGGKVNGKPIEVVTGDTLQKSDVASTIVREWFDRDNVDAVVDIPGTPVALAVLEIARQQNKIAFITESSTTQISGKRCAPTVFQWAFDTYNLSVGTTRTLAKRGLKSWYFLVVDLAFGEEDFTYASRIIRQTNGSILGSVKHPRNATDLSSQLLQAQASKAQVIVLANGPPDNLNAIKQGEEFRIREGGQLIVPLQIELTDIHSLGLKTAQGLTYTTGFYWDMDPETRAWSKRYFDKMKVMPTWYHAALYSAVKHYLKAVQAANTTDGPTVAAKMRELPVVDFMAKQGKIRPDNRMAYPLYLVQIKSPQESKYPWDYYKVLATISPEEGYIPLAESECPMVKK